jgi:hypothetical protein
MYAACGKQRLGRIAVLKQHLRRSHNCEHESHDCIHHASEEKSRAVERLDRAHENGILDCPSLSKSQIKTLRQYSTRGKPPEIQWYTIWELIFPGVPPPFSVYIGSQWEETFETIRHLWRQNRGTITPDLLGIGYLDEQHLDYIFSEILDRLLLLTPAQFPAQCLPLQGPWQPNIPVSLECLSQPQSIDPTAIPFGFNFFGFDSSIICNPDDVSIRDVWPPTGYELPVPVGLQGAYVPTELPLHSW